MRYFLNAGIAILSITLSGCNLYSPSIVNESKIQVREKSFSQDVLFADIDDAFIANLARNHSKYSNEPMNITVTYDPKSNSNTPMSAANKIANITKTLRSHGVTDIKSTIMPITSQGDDTRVVISYASFKAHAPAGCDQLMPGINGGHSLENRDNYKLGCSINTMLAKQISKPSDLLGRGATNEPTDGRAAFNIVDGYRTGEKNPRLKGFNATLGGLDEAE